MVSTHSCIFGAARRLVGAVTSTAKTEGTDGGAGKPGGYSNTRDGIENTANVTSELGGVLRTIDS